MKVRHIGIVTQHMDAEVAFYEKLGGKVVYDQVEKVRIVKMDMGDTKIELLQYESMSECSLRKLGISHVAFETDPEGNNLEMVCLKD